MRLYLFLLTLAAVTAALAVLMGSPLFNAPPPPDAVLLSLRAGLERQVGREIVPQRKRLAEQFAMVEGKRRQAANETLQAVLAQELQEIVRGVVECDRRQAYARDMIERIDSARRRLERATGGPLPPGLAEEIAAIQRDLQAQRFTISELEIDLMLQQLEQALPADPSPARPRGLALS